MTDLPRTRAASPASERDRLPVVERWLLGALFAAAFVLRAVYARNFRIDSDEPQHLHVVWGWAHGALPYRDLFDNHMPLFQALCAPFFRACGVRADIIVPMRLLMAVPFAVTLACVARIGANLFSVRAGAWAAAVAMCCPPFFLTSLEFRPDDLWTMFWMLALAIFSGGAFRPRRAFFGGLALGLAFCVSMKSTLMLAAVLLAALVVAIWHWQRRVPGERLPSLAGAGAALAGLLLPPALVVLFFVAQGAGPEFSYCVIEHNVPPGHQHLRFRLNQFLDWEPLLLLPLAGIFFSPLLRRQPAKLLGALFVYLAACIYWIALVGCWPILTAEDYLPFPPAVLSVVVAGVFATLASRLSLRGLPAVLALLAVIGEAAWIVVHQPPLENQTADKIGLVADALRLTSSDDYVLDGKGETIYRRRPFYYVLEGLTHRRLRAGLIHDDIAERLIATGTPVVTLRRMPATVVPFLSAEYLPIAFRLRVLGKMIYTPGARPRPRPESLSFEVKVPGRYTIVAESGTLAGTLNGEALSGPRELAPGHYEFHPVGGEGRLALIWAAAIERGFSPFAPIKPDYITEQD
jgi:hypothetical protein